MDAENFSKLLFELGSALYAFQADKKHDPTPTISKLSEFLSVCNGLIAVNKGIPEKVNQEPFVEFICSLANVPKPHSPEPVKGTAPSHLVAVTPEKREEKNMKESKAKVKSPKESPQKKKRGRKKAEKKSGESNSPTPSQKEAEEDSEEEFLKMKPAENVVRRIPKSDRPEEFQADWGDGLPDATEDKKRFTAEGIKMTEEMCTKETPPSSPQHPRKIKEHPWFIPQAPPVPWQMPWPERKKPETRRQLPYKFIQESEIDFNNPNVTNYYVEIVKPPILRNGKEAKTWDECMKYIRSHRKSFINSGYFKFVPIKPVERVETKEEKEKKELLCKRDEELTKEQLKAKEEAIKTVANVGEVHKLYRKYCTYKNGEVIIPKGPIEIPKKEDEERMKLNSDISIFPDEVREGVKECVREAVGRATKKISVEDIVPISTWLSAALKHACGVSIYEEVIKEALHGHCTSIERITDRVLHLIAELM